MVSYFFYFSIFWIIKKLKKILPRSESGFSFFQMKTYILLYSYANNQPKTQNSKFWPLGRLWPQMGLPTCTLCLRSCGKTLVADVFYFFTVPFLFFWFHNSVWDFRSLSSKFGAIPSCFPIFFDFSYFSPLKINKKSPGPRNRLPLFSTGPSYFPLTSCKILVKNMKFWSF